MARHTGRRAAGLAAAAVMAVTVLTAGAAPAEEAPAPSGDGRRFSALASGDGLHINFSMPGFAVVEDIIDVGAPTAQAKVDSLSGSGGYASAPYPGQAIITGPGSFAIVTGQQFPGYYPWYTASSYPSKEKGEVAQGPILLQSTSQARSTHAVARLGAPEGSGRSVADATAGRADDGTVSAAATTYADLVKVGPVTVSGLTSTASVIRRPGAKPERSSSLRVAGVTIGDASVALTERGLVLAPPGAKEGSPFLVADAPGVRDTLARAHVTVEAIKPSESPDGVVAPGLRISTTQPIPGAGVPGTVTYTLGQASAFASLEGDVSAGGAGTLPAPSDGAGSGSSGGAPAPAAVLPGGGSGGGGGRGPAGSVGPVPGALPPGTGGFIDTGRGTDTGGFTGTGTGTDAGAGLGGLGGAISSGTGHESATPPPTPARLDNQLAAIGTPAPAKPVAAWALFPLVAVAGAIVALVLHGARLMRVRQAWNS